LFRPESSFSDPLGARQVWPNDASGDFEENLHHRNGTSRWVIFGEQTRVNSRECRSQFTSEKFDHAFSEYDLFRLVEQPGLLLTEFQPANA